MRNLVGYLLATRTIDREIQKHQYYRNYCIDYNQILHNDKAHPVHSGPNRRTTNPKWRTAALLKNDKSPKSFAEDGALARDVARNFCLGDPVRKSIFRHATYMKL